MATSHRFFMTRYKNMTSNSIVRGLSREHKKLADKGFRVYMGLEKEVTVDQLIEKEKELNENR